MKSNVKSDKNFIFNVINNVNKLIKQNMYYYVAFFAFAYLSWFVKGVQ